jgi:hypothetical protein
VIVIIALEEVEVSPIACKFTSAFIVLEMPVAMLVKVAEEGTR